MDLKFQLAQPGAVLINSATFLHLSEDSFLFSVDCKQKYPEAMVDWIDEDEDGTPTLTIMVFPGPSTLHVPKDAPFDEEGEAVMTLLQLHGLTQEWYFACEEGKWGPYVYGVRRSERDESWPHYSSEGEVPEQEGVFLKPLPPYGDHMTLASFQDTGFRDFDGNGNYATATQITDLPARPSEVTQNPDTRWTHVVWFNK